MSRVVNLRILMVFALMALLLPANAGAEQSLAGMGKGAPPQYFAEFYSYQGGLLNAPAKSHTFARYFKMENGMMSEIVDISWLPAPGYFRRGNKVPLLGTVPGHNYSLGETMAIAGGKSVTSEGQFPISPELFEAAKRRKSELESSGLQYRMLGGPGSPNCIEAVSGVLGHLRTGTKRGEAAAEAVVEQHLSSGQMGSQWKNGGTPSAGATETTPSASGYRTAGSAATAPQPITHSSNGVIVYPAGMSSAIPARRPGFFRRR